MTMSRSPWQDVRALPQRLIERLSPKQRQYAMLCTLMASRGRTALVDFQVFTDNGQKTGMVHRPLASRLQSTGVMPPGAQVNWSTSGSARPDASSPSTRANARNRDDAEQGSPDL